MNISAKAVRFDDDFDVGRIVGRAHDRRPVCLVPAPAQRQPRQREAVEIGHFGLHWDEIDEDISVAGLLAGGGTRPQRPGARADEAAEARMKG